MSNCVAYAAGLGAGAHGTLRIMRAWAGDGAGDPGNPWIGAVAMSGTAELGAAITAGVLQLMGGATPCYADRHEPPELKAAQAVMIAQGTTIAAMRSRDPVDTAAMLYAIGYQESGWCLHVHSGAHGGRGRGLWQVEPGSNAPREGARTGVTAEATATSAIAAAWVLQRSW